MAESKSTLIRAPGNSSSPAVLRWSTIASAENNTYFDVNPVDASKMVILVVNNRASNAISTGGYFYIGSSDSAASGSTFGYPYSASKLRRMRLRAPLSTLAKVLLPKSTGSAQLSVFGPFETARFKSSQGFVKFCKAKNATDIARTYVAAILIP